MAFITKHLQRRKKEKLEALGYKFADKEGRYPLTIHGCGSCFGWGNAVNLSESAEKGQCLCCMLVFKAFINVLYDSDTGRWGKTRNEIRVLTKLDESSAKQTIDVDIGGGQLELFSTQGDTGSQAAFEWAKTKYRECLRHERCFTLTTAALPSRVVDLRISNGQEGFTSSAVRLYETKNELGQWCTLSHCWGTRQLIKTTKGSIAQHKRCIPLESLSKTFREAIEVARFLQIRYMWIDSLCIVQDDVEDWKRESSKMFYIYSNSILTIAATKSASGDEGCFDVSDKQHLTRPVQYDYDGTPRTIYARKRIGHEQYRRNMRQVEALPLLERGWVLQERLSSPRVLHFGPNELVFECRTGVQCECEGINDPNSSAKQEHHESLHNLEFSKLADYYRKLVVSYTRLKFTFESDRLQAFQGLSDGFQLARADDVMLSGIWEKSLMDDLLWHVHMSVTFRTKTKRGLFPSWSWASVNCHVEYLHSDDYDLNESASKFVAVSVSSDSLAVKGPVIRARLVHGRAVTGVNAERRNDYFLEPMSASLEGRAPIRLDADYDLGSEEASNDGRYLAHGKVLLCFMLAKTKSRTFSWVLNPLDANETGFERIGICTAFTRDSQALFGATPAISTIIVA